MEMSGRISTWELFFYLAVAYFPPSHVLAAPLNLLNCLPPFSTVFSALYSYFRCQVIQGKIFGQDKSSPTPFILWLGKFLNHIFNCWRLWRRQTRFLETINQCSNNHYWEKEVWTFENLFEQLFSNLLLLLKSSFAATVLWRNWKNMDVACIICEDNFDPSNGKMIATPCGHVFHQVCANQWFEKWVKQL